MATFVFQKCVHRCISVVGDVLQSVTIPDRVRWVGGSPFTYFPTYVRS